MNTRINTIRISRNTICFIVTSLSDWPGFGRAFYRPLLISVVAGTLGPRHDDRFCKFGFLQLAVAASLSASFSTVLRRDCLDRGWRVMSQLAFYIPLSGFFRPSLANCHKMNSGR